jgi:hypothetical protein
LKKAKIHVSCSRFQALPAEASTKDGSRFQVSSSRVPEFQSSRELIENIII